MLHYPKPLEEMIEHFCRFPGIGAKTAERLAFFLLQESDEFTRAISSSLLNLKSNLRKCELCGNLSEDKLCLICDDPGRDKTRICVVEEIKDIIAIEKTEVFTGSYHVLGGVISPLKGIKPEDLSIQFLLKRVLSSKPEILEVILALNPSLEGETTAIYLKNLLLTYPVNLSQIVYGVPLGGDLEFTDKVTLGRSLRDRKLLKKKEN
ncbi:recombination mediator RecR [Candidatus Riflebacteria bacterium]